MFFFVRTLFFIPSINILRTLAAFSTQVSHFAQNTSGRVFQGWEYSFLEMDGKQRIFMKVESFGTSCPVPRCSSCWTRTNRWTLTPWRPLLRRTIGAEIRFQWGRHISLDPRRYLKSLLSPTNWPTATITRAHKSCWESITNLQMLMRARLCFERKSQVFSFFSHQNVVKKSFPCNTVGGSKTGDQISIPLSWFETSNNDIDMKVTWF